VGEMMKEFKSKNRISKVETTEQTITGRGGISLFVRYLEQINIYSLLTGSFGNIRKSIKGIAIWNLFKQIFCFLYDGTSQSISYFDELRKDTGYTQGIENTPKEMASSHTIKRFFKKFSFFCLIPFRGILKHLFLWRLRIDKPKVVELTADTMIMDNDESKKREGVGPTYKKEKGFQPLHLIWNGKIVDAIFRGGSKHGNSGTAFLNMIRDAVKLIRERYNPDITIILRIDAGFYDELNLMELDKLNIGFIISGKKYESIKEYITNSQEDCWKEYKNNQNIWRYKEFGYRGKSWDKFYRAFYTHVMEDNRQVLLEFARPDNIILTNIGINPSVLKSLSESEKEIWLNPETIIHSHHQRGADELPHRGLKDFGFEQLPFKRFAANTAFYYCMIIAFFLFETFKEDVLKEVMPVTAYASTVRRKLLDFAAKIIYSGKKIILKIHSSIMELLKIKRLWELCQNPIPIKC